MQSWYSVTTLCRHQTKSITETVNDFRQAVLFFYFLKLFPLPQILTKQFTLVITYQALFFMDD